MKNVLLLFIPLLFWGSCKNIEQFRAPIEALSADWDKASGTLTQVKSLLELQHTNISTLYDTMNFDEKLFGESAIHSLNEAKKAIITQRDGMAGLLQTANNYISEWGNMGSKLTSLKEGLAAGSIEGDVPAQIEELKKAVVDCNGKTAEWNKKVEDVMKTVFNANRLWRETISSK